MYIYIICVDFDYDVISRIVLCWKGLDFDMRHWAKMDDVSTLVA